MLFCLVAPIIGTYCWLQYKIAIVKKVIEWRILEGIDKGELVLLKFTKAASQTELRWEHSGEFEYKGQMYDIIETEIKGDTIYYWCWWDIEETKLKKQLTELAIHTIDYVGQNTAHQKRLINFYKSLFHPATVKWKFLLSSSKRKANFQYSFHYSSLSFPPPIPPPKLG